MSSKTAKAQRRQERLATGSCLLDNKRSLADRQYEEEQARRQAAEKLKRENPEEWDRRHNRSLDALRRAAVFAAAIGGLR